ncbi:DUF6087 family protein [Streptacidiphilus anmyonensis]|uniref:DUF6087 family protein n=1 Tax=Streptacidiphilus anmyonensis TaxID=405782 RepID=UPI00069467C2|nr:DUF6087 family protein [Streptacidiphilus anmyonensis]
MDEPLERWAARRDARRRPVGVRCAMPLEGGPARAAHTRPAARWLLFEWDGYQWVAQGVADDYAASRRYLARIEGDGVVRALPTTKAVPMRGTGRHRRPAEDQ